MTATATDITTRPVADHASRDLPVTFRQAVAADALCLGVLGLQVFLDTYATDGIRAEIAREVLAQFDTDVVATLLAAPDTCWLVAERDGHLIGFAQCAMDDPHDNVDATRPTKLNRLYVQERFAGRGVGSALLARIEALVTAEGSDCLWLTTWVGNARALAFYPRRGYADVGTTLYVFEQEAHENRVFAKPLR